MNFFDHRPGSVLSPPRFELHSSAGARRGAMTKKNQLTETRQIPFFDRPGLSITQSLWDFRQSFHGCSDKSDPYRDTCGILSDQALRLNHRQ